MQLGCFKCGMYQDRLGSVKINFPGSLRIKTLYSDTA